MTWVPLTWPIHLRHRLGMTHVSPVVTIYQFSLSCSSFCSPFFSSLSLCFSLQHICKHITAHIGTHIFSLPVAFLIMHFLKWAKSRAGAKHQAMTMWKLTSFRGVRRLVGESKAKQHDLITDPMHVDAVQYVPCLILSWASIFLYSCGVLEIALSHFRLLCSLPGCPVDSCPVT